MLRACIVGRMRCPQRIAQWSYVYGPLDSISLHMTSILKALGRSSLVPRMYDLWGLRDLRDMVPQISPDFAGKLCINHADQWYARVFLLLRSGGCVCRKSVVASERPTCLGIDTRKFSPNRNAMRQGFQLGLQGV